MFFKLLIILNSEFKSLYIVKPKMGNGPENKIVDTFFMIEQLKTSRQKQLKLG